ncbi:pilus assembly protein TadG-related protein [Rugamonas sp. CCM 8940]|uniref:pilus assembly protein TadG-related protein n=1 Tax=Rugamonas sp. CCM 8940 TaxID=2765359 RepID=UPI0018F2E8CE|nr:pilus assembly protein TadG-related protein [Rugamonas sp. CCM 8940]MBJ7311689.1 Tad domain-containing protein [Rugamonas sp. CCM 8940]
MFSSRTPHRSIPRRARQTGQALVYGLFVLIAGLVALFFMFNTGQLTAEKTKLVNTADAVAYSAAVMHARALNFDAYTNRALMANEVLAAQMVSVSSWLEYAVEHSESVTPLNCLTYYSVPLVLVMSKYELLCAFLSVPTVPAGLEGLQQVVDGVAPVAMAVSELAKAALQTSQLTMYASFLPARQQLLRQVADANYAGIGPVKVDTVPLLDNYSLFDGKPFIAPYNGNDRTRFKDAETRAAYKDGFVAGRNWDSRSPWPCIPGLVRGIANRSGSTALQGFDDWTASDSAYFRTERMRGWLLKCRGNSMSLGDGYRSAKDWGYSGVPNFFDLSSVALGYTPDNTDVNKRDPRLKFAIRLTRANTDAATSTGTSQVKPSGRMEVFQGAEAKGVMAAVSSSEVYFERMAPNPQGKELPSLFNPYWQAHLIATPPAVLAAAVALQNSPP